MQVTLRDQPDKTHCAHPCLAPSSALRPGHLSAHSCPCVPMLAPCSSSMLVPKGSHAVGWERGHHLASRQRLGPWAGVGQITSSAISAGEVSSLDHEVLDHTVELAALEAESFLRVGREKME